MLRRLRLPCCLVALVVSAAACKQGEGEPCQVNADCDEGLVCAPLTDTCERTAGPTVDAGPDAPMVDAAIDAPDVPPDAMIDAPDDEPDAMPGE